MLEQITERHVAELVEIVGESRVSTSKAELIAHSRDMWPRSVLWTKTGSFPYLPDAVVSPENVREVSRLLKWANEKAVPIVPFGAGSGVCAGTLPVKGGIVLNMKRMDALVDIDGESLIAEIEPGIYGETLERRLNPLGYTMGHFPSSIYCSTLGGYLAARSAGQMSSRYGKIEDMVVGLEYVLPDGSIHRTAPTPRGASIMDWNQILVGSEGSLGVITKAWMRIHHAPEHRRFQACHFPGVREGLDAMRRIMQAALAPSVLRLYDEFDTVVAGTHGSDSSLDDAGETASSPWQNRLVELAKYMKKKSLGQVLRQAKWLNMAVDKLPGRCLMVILTEGERDIADHEHRRIQRICRDGKGVDAGEGPARYWLEHRYSISYKQSKIFDAGGWVDTMETAAPWRDIEALYYGVREAVRKDAFIMAHFSHAYRDGCCIYFSFASASDTDEKMIRSHARVWEKALNAVRRYGGTITHHHGVGLSKAPFLPAELGELWPLMRRVKKVLDPKGIMNPGKLGEERWPEL